MEDIKKTILLEFQSNLAEWEQQLVSSSKSIEELRDRITKLKKEEGDHTLEIERAKAQLKEQQSIYNSASKSIQDYTKAINKAEGSQEQIQAVAALYNKELAKQEGLIKKDANGNLILSDAYIKASKNAKAANDANNQFNLGVKRGYTNVGLYGDSLKGIMDKMGGLPGPVGGAANAIKGLGAQFKALAANPIILVITGIASAIVGLIKIIKSSDSGSTWMATQWEKISAIFDVVRTRILAVVDAFKNIFSGKWSDAMGSMATAMGITGASFQDAAKAAKEYAYELDRIEDSENNYISEKAKNKRRIAELEFNAQDRKLTTEERRKALQEAIDISTEELKHEQKVRTDKLNNELDYLAKKNNVKREDLLAFINMTDEEQEKASNTLRNIRNNYEDKFKEIEQLYASVIETDTEFYHANKRNISRLSGFEKELAEEKAKMLEEQDRKRQKSFDDEKARQDQMNKDRKAYLEEQDRKRQKSFDDEKARQDQMNKDRKAYLDAEAAAEQAIIDTKQMLRKKAVQEDQERRRINLENQQEIDLMNAENEYQQQLMRLEMDYQNEINYANKKNADVTLIEKKYEKKREEIALAEKQAKLGIYASIASALSQLFGEQTALGKAAAVASTVINTYAGAMAAFKDTPGPIWLRLAAASTAVLTGLASIKKILSVNTNISKGASGGSVSAGIPRFVATRVNETANTAQGNISSAAASTGAVQNITNITNNNVTEAVKNIKVYATIEDIKKADKNYIKIENTGNL